MQHQSDKRVRYILFCRGLGVGGAEMLMKNIAGEWIRTGYSVEILCESVDPVLSAQLEADDIPVTKVCWDNVDDYLYTVSRQVDELRVVTFFWLDFVGVYRLKCKNLKPLFYVLILHELSLGIRYVFPIRHFLKNLVRKTMVNLLKSRNIICMDELTVECSMQYYSLPSEIRSAFSIVRIPVVIQPVSEEVLSARACDNHCNILTIARAYFPSKGYLLGLIRFFAEHDLGEDVSLTVIAYGKDEDQLRQAYLEVPEEKRRRIQLVDKTDHRELAAYIDKAKLYVGMGTTLLDASQRGLVSVPVMPYTNELRTDDFFFENFFSLDAIRGETPFEELLRQVKSWTEDEYLMFSRQSRQGVIQHYGSEAVARQLAETLDETDFRHNSFTISFIAWLFRMKDRLSWLTKKLRRSR